jgi:hypothetical protein
VRVIGGTDLSNSTNARTPGPQSKFSCSAGLCRLTRRARIDDLMTRLLAFSRGRIHVVGCKRGVNRAFGVSRSPANFSSNCDLLSIAPDYKQTSRCRGIQQSSGSPCYGVG